MSKSEKLGEFEQVVLLSIMQCGDSAFSLKVRKMIAELAERTVSRGAYYATLDRLERKGFVEWREETDAERWGDMPLRVYSVTGAGVEALRHSRAVLERLWDGLDEINAGVS